MSFKQLTFERAHDLLDYEPDTGVLRWRESKGRGAAGQEAGGIHSGGYIRVSVDGRRYQAHRLAWLLTTKRWPKCQIDHINGIRNDNRWANLREANQSENSQNVGGAKKSNTSGFQGVHWHGHSSKWHARIRVNGKRKSLGYYDSPEEAGAAYAKAQEQYHPFRRKTDSSAPPF